MTSSSPNLVRLIAAVAGLLASVWFVVTYTRMSHFRFMFEHEAGSLISINEILVQYASWLYLLPAITLPMGLWLIWRHPQAVATFEGLVSAAWLLALGLAGLCILSWQAQNVPTFSHMEWHY